MKLILEIWKLALYVIQSCTGSSRNQHYVYVTKICVIKDNFGDYMLDRAKVMNVDRRRAAR